MDVETSRMFLRRSRLADVPALFAWLCGTPMPMSPCKSAVAE
jgi:hypothetical protein